MNVATREQTWAEIIATAKERKAIGQTDCYLGSNDRDDIDWSTCVGMEPGGSHRLDISTSIWFHFEVAGLSLRWSFDIEKDGANGRSHYMIDTPGILSVLARLPADVKPQFQAYLAECADAIQKRAEETLAFIQDEIGSAAVLRSLAK